MEILGIIVSWISIDLLVDSYFLNNLKRTVDVDCTNDTLEVLVPRVVWGVVCSTILTTKF
jgi:hypothetical protein